MAEKVSIVEELFPMYAEAINEIDDYFEYRHESEKDKAFVMGVIDRLANDVAEVNNKKT